MLSLAVSPKDGVGNMNGLVGIQRDVNLVQQVAMSGDEICQRLHVLFSALYIKGTALWVAEVVLGVDDDHVRLHISLSSYGHCY